MKNRLICLCAIIYSFMSVTAFTQVTDITPTSYGIWQSFGDPVSATVNPEIKGRLCNFKWADIQPAEDTWNWSNFDRELAARADDNLPIIFMVYTEEDAPSWLYSKGVSKVIQKDRKGNVIAESPYFKDPLYKSYFKTMIHEVRAHVETLPAYIRNQVVAVQACLGSTGDYISYKGDVDFQYRIGNGEFYALFQEFSQVFYDEYKNTTPKIYVLHNPKNNGPEQASWIFQNCPGGWIKIGSIGKGFQLNDEKTKAGWLYPLLNKKILNGEYVRSRSEIIGGSTKAPWWTKAPAKNMFALMCYGIYWGLDWSNQGYDQIGDNIYDSAFGFYNRYAGKKDPTQSVYAMCALKDVLDASDKSRFPENRYGNAVRGNDNRYIKIANEYAPFGAKLEDTYIAMGDELGNLSAKGTNDVGWDLFAGNYDRYIKQVKSNETSVGYWNIESADKNSIYGKYGRGFDLAKGKDALYFNIEDTFFNNVPLNSTHPVVLEVVYFDNNNGSWNLVYDGADNTDKVALTVTGKKSMLWKKASVTLTDAYFGNRGKNGTDFYIKNAGTENVIFSIVELRRPVDGEKPGLTATELKPFSTACSQGPTFQVLHVGGAFLPDGDAVVGPLKGFSFSIDSGKTYPDSVIIKDHGAQFNQKIFVKYTPAAEGTFNGAIPVRADNVEPIAVNVTASSVNSSPQLSQTIKNISCFGANDGAIDLNCKGGIGPFTYSWTGVSNFKASSEDISGLAPGNYIVTVTSPGGCTAKTTVEIKSPKALVINANAPQIPANENTTTLTVTAAGGIAPYTGIGSFTVTPGTYNYKVTDANGCVTSTQVTVTKSAGALSAFASSKNISCHGGFTTITVNAQGGKLPYKGTGDYIVSAGTYTYIVKDAEGTESSVTVSVTEPAVLNAFTEQEEILCNGDTATITVTATGGVTPYAGTGNFSVRAGVYTYTVTDANGCRAVKTINVAQPTKLKASVSANDVLCNGSTTDVTVSASGGVAPYTGTGNFTVQAGTHEFSVKDNNGCEVLKSVEVIQPEPLQINAVAAPLAENKSTTTVTIAATGGVAPYSGIGNFETAPGTHDYVITDANGCKANTSVTVSNSEIKPLVINVTAKDISCAGGTTNVNVVARGGIEPYIGTGTFSVTAGTYTYTVTDANGSTAQSTITLTEPMPLAVSFNDMADVAACQGASVAIAVDVVGGTAPYQYNINAGAYQSSREFKNLSDGAYTIIVKDDNGCLASTSAVVNKVPAMRAWLTEVLDVSHCGFTDGSLTVANQGGIGPFMYSIDGDTYQSSNVFSNLPENDYTISIKDNRGCGTTALTTVAREAELKLSVTNNIPVSGCSNNDGELTVSASGGAGSYQYCVNGQPFKKNSVFSSLAAGDYTVTVQDWRGCSKSITVTVAKTAPLSAKIQSVINAGSCSNDGSLTLTVNGGTAPYSYSVNGGATQSSNVFNQLAAGIYKVSVSDARGCMITVMATISKNAQLELGVTAVDASCVMAADGAITATVSGGIAPYRFSIDGKSFVNSNVFSNLRAGKHVINVTDSKGCTATASVTVMEGTGSCGPTLPNSLDVNSDRLQVAILNNPSPTNFTLITNSLTNDKLDVYVIDVTGKVIYKTTGSSNQRYVFGSDFASGMYIVRAIKGVQVADTKIIKQ